jgi:molybdopterin-guanine dinucleotide biosynthesis protein A
LSSLTLVAGIFVGGPGSRMGGVPKGLLRGPDGVTLVERWRALLDALGVEVVLVGSAGPYASTGLPALADEPAGIGPLGGLVALLRRAGPRTALALACDMPFVSRGLVERLLGAPTGPSVVAPRRDGLWEPLCARYDAARVLPAAAAHAASPYHSLQRLLESVGAAELPLGPGDREDLRDWDTPDDVRGS